MIVALIGTLIFFAGFVTGYLMNRLSSKSRSSGTIYVTKNAEKTLYSLELDEYPENIAFKKEVVFKVESPKNRG